jgi:hypothetical protein
VNCRRGQFIQQAKHALSRGEFIAAEAYPMIRTAAARFVSVL